ncbi:hypothetical protein BASA61_005274 [Batrachochytrium salamandrivorans]|nr:hypothetical protein BASA61_005274 [Batrachochytrium salamandrivorans]KAJ1338861.1 hypothetical protein BSLG_006498 [Batrachochytrium salamandrivorans]
MASIGFSMIVAATPEGGIGYKGNIPWRLPNDMDHFMRITMHLGRTPGLLPYAPLPDESEGGVPEMPSKTTASQADPECRNVVIMGRKTWHSIPKKFRPLRGRINVVLTRGDESIRSAISSEGLVDSPVHICTGFDEALNDIANMHVTTGHTFVIGGSQLYSLALAHPQCHTIFLTQVEPLCPDSNADGSESAIVNCDTFIPRIPMDSFQELIPKDILRLLGPNVDLSKQKHKKFVYQYLVYTRTPAPIL